MASQISVHQELKRLNFHFSIFRCIEILFSEGIDRGCRIHIDYYDWEGNEARRENDPSAEWLWKALTIGFGYLAHFEFSAPGHLNHAQNIDALEFDHQLERLRQRETWFRKTPPAYESPLFGAQVEPLSLKFLSSNEIEDEQGYILVIGSMVQLIWGGFEPAAGQFHFLLKEDPIGRFTRVWELARELGITSKQIVMFCQDHSASGVTSHMSLIGPEVEMAIRRRFEK